MPAPPPKDSIRVTPLLIEVARKVNEEVFQMLDTTAATNSGVSNEPDRVADTPSTPCMKRGT